MAMEIFGTIAVIAPDFAGQDRLPADGTAGRPAFPLCRHTLEALYEVLVMLPCGQDIVLLVDRDPWQWEHTAEELRVAQETFGAELEALRALTSVLSEAIGAEHAAE